MLAEVGVARARVRRTLTQKVLLSRPRVDIYRFAHKALRAELFELGVQVGKTDFTDASEVDALEDQLARTMELMFEHAGHEERFMHPPLGEETPVAMYLGAEHAELEAASGELRSHLTKVTASHDSTDRFMAGRDFMMAANRVIAGFLRHFDREESAATQQLWAQLTDEELMTIVAEVQASLPTSRFRMWQRIMLRAASRSDVIDLMRGMRLSVPEDRFRVCVEVAREVLGEHGWAEIEPAVTNG